MTSTFTAVVNGRKQGWIEQLLPWNATVRCGHDTACALYVWFLISQKDKGCFPKGAFRRCKVLLLDRAMN